jgi:hypothetical protein
LPSYEMQLVLVGARRAVRPPVGAVRAWPGRCGADRSRCYGTQTTSCANCEMMGFRTMKVCRRSVVGFGKRGWRLPAPRETTDDPALCLLAANWTIKPLSGEGRRHVFMVPHGVHHLRLVSRSAVPCEQSVHGSWTVDGWASQYTLMSLTLDQRTNIDGVPKAVELIEISGGHALEASDRAIMNMLYQHAHDSGRLADPTASWGCRSQRFGRRSTMAPTASGTAYRGFCFYRVCSGFG